MTINGLSSQSSLALSANNTVKMATSADSSASAVTTAELTDEEKDYDIDGDGTLSITERAAYLEAKSQAKATEAVSKMNSQETTDSVSISDDALKLQKEGKLKISQQDSLQGSSTEIGKMAENKIQNREAMVKMQEMPDEQKSRQSENEYKVLMEKAVSQYNKFKL